MKILVIRLSSIGDIVMMTPVVRCLKKQLHAEVHFLTKAVFAPLVESNPYIDVVHHYEDIEKDLSILKKIAFNFCADLHNNLRSNKLTRQLGLPTKRLSKLTFSKFLKIYVGIDRLPRNTHVAHRALQVIKHLGVHDDSEGMEIFFNKHHQYPLPFQEAFCTIGIGTAKFTKNIPKTKWLDFIANTTLPIILLGGSADQSLGDELAETRTNVINLAGKTSLMQSAWIVGQSRVFIGGDTGLLHIACALNIRTVSIWGATIPEFGVFPYYGSSAIEHVIHEIDLPCRPCSKHGTQSCPKKHMKCMTAQNPTEIVTSTKKLFSTQ